MKRTLLWISVLGLVSLYGACSHRNDLGPGQEITGSAGLSSQDIPVASKPGGQPKVNICHWDADGEGFKLIRIAAPAVSAHLNHGDFIDDDGTLDCKTGTCPQDLRALPFWFEASPGFSNVNQIHMVATFKNQDSFGR